MRALCSVIALVGLVTVTSLGFAIGGTGGAGIGALVGLAFPRWRPRVP